MILIYKGGERKVRVGDCIQSLGGNYYVVIGFTPPNASSQVGRIYVTCEENETFMSWFYPSELESEYVFESERINDYEKKETV